MEPPPAPISTISMTGMRTGKPLPFMNRYCRSTSKLREVSGVPSSIRQIFAVVPPMSNDSTRGTSIPRAIVAARIAPPAGPLSTSRIGNRIAVAKVVKPPPDVINSKGQVNPCPCKRCSSCAR